MTFTELASFIRRVLPSGESVAGQLTFEHYRIFILSAAVVVSTLVFLIIYLIKSKNVRLPRLTEFGMFLIMIGMISVADRLFGEYSDPFATALTWFFISSGFIVIIASAAWQYFEVCAKIKKKGERASDFMPLEMPEEVLTTAQPKKDFKFVAPKGVRPPEEWRG